MLGHSLSLIKLSLFLLETRLWEHVPINALFITACLAYSLQLLLDGTTTRHLMFSNTSFMKKLKMAILTGYFLENSSHLVVL